MPNWKKVLTSGSTGDLSSLHISGDLNVENNILVSGSIEIDSVNNAEIVLNRSTSADNSAIYFDTDGTTDWKIGVGFTGIQGSFNPFRIYNGVNQYFQLTEDGDLNLYGDLNLNGYFFEGHQVKVYSGVKITGSLNNGFTFQDGSTYNGGGASFLHNSLNLNLRTDNDVNRSHIYFNTQNNTTGSFEIRHDGLNGEAALRLYHTPSYGNSFIGNSSYLAFNFEDRHAYFKHPAEIWIETSGSSAGLDVDFFTVSNAELKLGVVNNAGTDTDKFLVLDANGKVEFRTGAEVRVDIGASATIDSIGGSGTHHYVARFSGSDDIEDSTIINTDTYTHVIHSSNNNDIFKVSGSNGEQIIVNDSVSNFPFQVNNGSGLPIFRVSSSAEVDFYGPLHVGTNVIYQGGVNNNFIDLDYDESGDRDNSVAIGSVQSIHMFLDTNNNETGNYFGIFNGLTRTDTAEDSDAIFLVNEDGDVKLDSLGVGTAASGVSGEIRATNDVTAYYSSDSRLKTDVKPIEDPLDKLKEINGVTFNWIPKEGIHSHEGSDIGVIAQEIETVLPDLVQTRDNGYKAVQYEKIVALLIETNKELLKRVEVLENKIK